MESHSGDNDNDIAFDAARYRELARSLRVLAATASGEAAHNAFLALAEQYEGLADTQKEKDRELQPRNN